MLAQGLSLPVLSVIHVTMLEGVKYRMKALCDY